MQIERETSEGATWQTAFSVRLSLGPGLTHRERIILYNSARHCEVHKLLDGEIHVAYELEETKRDT